MNTTDTSTPEPRQLRLDWPSATKRKLLTRLADALKGRTLGDPDRPKEKIKGSTVDLVLQGLHGWCITDGSTDRPPREICGSLSEPTVRRVLAYLQSDEAESCVAIVDRFRYRNSPRTRRSICWANLEAWCERLEQEQIELIEAADEFDEAAELELSEAKHPIAAIGSYIEDGPKTVHTVPPTEPAERMSEVDADRIEQVRGGSDSDFKTTEARRHGGNSRGVTGPRRPQTTRNAGVLVKAQTVESCIAKETEVGLNDPYLGAVREPAEVSLGSPSVPPCLSGSSIPLRAEIESILNDQLGVDAAKACVDQALRTQTIEQIAATVRYAAGEAIGDLQAWGPGFVYQRVIRPPGDAQGPQDGWAKRRPEWMLAKARHAERERRERAERIQRAEHELRRRRPAVEAFYGPLIDRLYREDKQALLDQMTPAERSIIRDFGGTFTSRGVRDIFLLAALQGRFEDVE